MDCKVSGCDQVLPSQMTPRKIVRVHWQDVLRSGYSMQECLCLLEVGCVKPFGKPVIDPGQ